MSSPPSGSRALADLRAERAVIGSVIIEPDAWDVADEVITASDFSSDAHAEIWRALDALVAAGTPIDSVTLRGKLEDGGKLQRVGGDEYLLGLTETIPTIANTEAYATRIRQLGTLRRVRDTLARYHAELQSEVEDIPDYLDRVETAITHACERRAAKTDPVHVGDAGAEYLADLEQRQHTGETVGHKTGYGHLDHYLGGVVPQETIVVAGRPGMGKTAFALDIAKGVARTSGMGVYVQSIEMPRRKLIERMLSGEAAVDSDRLRTLKLGNEDWRELVAANERLSRLSIHIDDTSGVTILDIKRSVRRHKRKLEREGKKLGLVVIDYLQLIKAHTRADKREEQIGDISREMTAMCKQLDVAVMALASLNRDCEKRPGKDKRPAVSDLRESGAIESDASTVLLLYRDEVYNHDTSWKGVAEIIIGKQRNGKTGTVRMAFRKEFTRFDALEQQPEPDERDHSPHWSESA